MESNITQQPVSRNGPENKVIIWLAFSMLPAKISLWDRIKTVARWGWRSRQAGYYEEFEEIIGWVAVEMLKEREELWRELRDVCSGKKAEHKGRQVKGTRIHRIVRGFAMQAGKPGYQPARRFMVPNPDTQPGPVATGSTDTQPAPTGDPAAAEGALPPPPTAPLEVEHFKTKPHVLGMSQHIRDRELYDNPINELFITFCRARGLEDRHIPLGVVTEYWHSTLDNIEKLGSDSGKPIRPIIIRDAYVEVEAKGEDGHLHRFYDGRPE